MPSAVIRRTLFDQLGWFTDFLADDYEFFFRCLRSGSRFYYEPRTLVNYRRHDSNITNANAEVIEAMYVVRMSNLDRVTDQRLIDEVLAPELFKIGLTRRRRRTHARSAPGVSPIASLRPREQSGRKCESPGLGRDPEARRGSCARASLRRSSVRVARSTAFVGDGTRRCHDR